MCESGASKKTCSSTFTTHFASIKLAFEFWIAFQAVWCWCHINKRVFAPVIHEKRRRRRKRGQRSYLVKYPREKPEWFILYNLPLWSPSRVESRRISSPDIPDNDRSVTPQG